MDGRSITHEQALAIADRELGPSMRERAMAAEIARLRARVEELERERDNLRARLVCVHDAVRQNKSLDLIRVEVGYWLTCDDEIIKQCARELSAAREGE